MSTKAPRTRDEGPGTARHQSAVRGPWSPVRSKGFTLLELLVAAALTAALAGFLAIVVRNIGGTWSRASGKLSADAQARLVLDQLELDLQGALFRDDGN